MESADATMQIALRVALQTMKERCVALQGRLSAVEEENHELREQGSAQSRFNKSFDNNTENKQLHMQIAELQRQKTQLTEHINMVSMENRKLWSRLSQMAKDQGRMTNSKDIDGNVTNSNEQELIGSPRANGANNQNLIRSKTFTQHCPNPQLRHKLISNEISDDIKDLSLEEVGLNAYNEKNIIANKADLGFSYMNVDETAGATDALNTDFNEEAKKCIDGLQDIRTEALKQRQEILSAFAAIKKKLTLQPCSECALKKKKPEMADKSLETDDSLNDVKFSNKSQAVFDANTNVNSHKFMEKADKLNQTTQPLNIIEEKIKADEMDKMCPMCGKIYSNTITFDVFRQHVETHFIDDSLDVETSLERNFEFVSHAVGDF